nr:hypothetical protein [Tanacetum cinerariifolium]
AHDAHSQENTGPPARDNRRVSAAGSSARGRRGGRPGYRDVRNPRFCRGDVHPPHAPQQHHQARDGAAAVLLLRGRTAGRVAAVAARYHAHGGRHRRQPHLRRVKFYEVLQALCGPHAQAVPRAGVGR